MVFTYTIQVNTRKKEKKEKIHAKKNSRNNGSTNKVPTSKVDKYQDRDKRMLEIRRGKATGKISSESNQLYLTMIFSVLDRNKIKPNLINR